MKESDTRIRKGLRAGRLSRKLSIWLGLFFLIFWTGSTFALYGVRREEAVSDAEKECRMMLVNVDAAQEYVRQELRPVMYNYVDEECFIPEAMSTTMVSRSIVDRFRESYPDYYFKFATDNPRNPQNSADERELAILRYFITNPENEEWSGPMKWNDEPYISVATPIWFSTSCLSCHSDPGEAPQSLIDRYGDTAGFHRTAGEVALKIVGVPVGAALTEATRATLIYAVVSGLFFMGLFGLTYFLIRKFATTPLRVLRDEAEKVGAGELGRNIEINSGDEIEELADALNEMSRNLKEAHELLEQRVNDRTSELNDRVAELEVFNKTLVGRELRMIRLKEEVNELLDELNREKKYTPAEESDFREVFK